MFIFPLPLALETSFEEVAKVVKTGGLVGVTMRGEVNSIPEHLNCVLEVPETTEGVAEVVKTSRLVRVTMRGTNGAAQSRRSANSVRTNFSSQRRGISPGSRGFLLPFLSRIFVVGTIPSCRMGQLTK